MPLLTTVLLTRQVSIANIDVWAAASGGLSFMSTSFQFTVDSSTQI